MRLITTVQLEDTHNPCRLKFDIDVMATSPHANMSRGGARRKRHVLGVHLGRLYLGLQELKACGDGEEEQAFDEWEVADSDQHSDQRVEYPICGEESNVELTPSSTSVLHRR